MIMQNIQISCKVQGVIIIPNEFYTKEGFSISGNLADYSPTSAEILHKIASKYTWVERQGKKIKGASYTLKMAQNDFKNYAK